MEFYDFNHISFIFSFSLIAVALLSSLVARKIITSPQHDSFDHMIEGMRGLACILVFINHAPFILLENRIENGLNYSPFSSFNNFGILGVQVFFCITGYLFSRKIKKCNFDITFYAKRIKRLVPVYLVISSLVLLVFIYQNYNHFSFYRDFPSVFRQVFGFGFFGRGISTETTYTTALNVVTWTLPYEWMFYAAIPFISISMKDYRMLLFLITFGMISLVVDIQNDNIVWLYFLTGFISSYIKPINSTLLRYITIISSFLLLCLAILSTYPLLSFSRYIIVSLLFISLIASRPKILSSTPLSIIGTISYSFYLIHLLVLSVFTNFLSPYTNFTENGVFKIMLIGLISIFFSLVISSITYEKIEKKYS